MAMIIGIGQLEKPSSGSKQRSNRPWFESPFFPDTEEPTLFLDHPEYEFMHPWLERLDTRTGQWIELYSDALFAGEDLAALAATVAEIRDEVARQPDSWCKVVYQGTYPNSPWLPPVDFVVHKAPLMDLLTRWQQVIDRARETGRPVVCFGD